mmetsp:Transcript_73783/g.178142  ORF Transcript_73783/g.178142 Transcript_73783/m.178142 type:complete len:216 (-) Transcript_73783:631-1278(-)
MPSQPATAPTCVATRSAVFDAHPAPAQPEAQLQWPLTHSPWPEQPSTGHGRRSEQSAPSQPLAQKHAPALHTPCDEHSEGQPSASGCWTTTSPPPIISWRLSRLLRGVMYCWPRATACCEAVCCREAVGLAHAAPVHPTAHVHTPAMQRPCWEQPAGHGAAVAQSEPAQPATQVHWPSRHAPRPEQSCAQLVGGASMRAAQSSASVSASAPALGP